MTKITGMTGSGKTDLDFRGEDIDLDVIPNLEKADDIRIEVNQDDGDYKDFCTGMSSFSAGLSIFNHKHTKKEQREFLNFCIKNGYRVGKGRTLFGGVSNFCKRRNGKYPKKQVMYVRYDAGSKGFKSVLKKGYPIIMGHWNDSAYNLQKSANGVVSIKKQYSKKGGHAISTYLQEKYTHLNTYPNNPHNKYIVEHLEDLIKDKSYIKSSYAILPLETYKLPDLIQKKRIEKTQTLSFLTSIKSTDTEEKKTLLEYSEKLKTILVNNY